MSIFRILPQEVYYTELENGKTVRVCLYPGERVVHLHSDGQVLDWPKGYDKPCRQYPNELCFVRGKNTFVGQIDPDTHAFEGNVITLWPKNVDVTSIHRQQLYILKYPSARIVHIVEPDADPDFTKSKVFDWPNGYDGECSEYTDIKTYNHSPSKDIFTGTVDPVTHLRQGVGKRRFFNDPDAAPMPNGWLGRRHDNLNYMYIGNFVDGEISGEGTMIYMNGSAHHGTFDKHGIRKIHPISIETMHEGRATKANTRKHISSPTVILPVYMDYSCYEDEEKGTSNDLQYLRYEDGRKLQIDHGVQKIE